MGEGKYESGSENPSEALDLNEEKVRSQEISNVETGDLIQV